MDRKKPLWPQIYGDRSRHVPDRQGRPYRAHLAQGEGAGPCGGGAGGGASAGLSESVAGAARAVLLTPDPAGKVKAARRTALAWRLGRLDWCFDVAMPDRPARGDRPELLPPSRMP